MLKLKENCKEIKFNNLVLNDLTLTSIMYGTPTEEEAKKDIKDFEDHCISYPKYAEEYKYKIQNLKNLLNDTNYQSGLYPRSLEQIIQQIIEPISLWEAISTLEQDHFLTSKNYFHSLIEVSITFMLSCEIAKLFNDQKGDFSLLNIWKESKNKVLSGKITCIEEVEYIDQQFKKGPKREAAIQRLIDFRNKQVAHNSASDYTATDDFVFTIKFILRVWTILDALYSPNCFPKPIYMNEQLFEGFRKIMSPEELKKVKKSRLDYINNILKASQINLATGVDDGKISFSNIKITIKTGF